ncbi:4-alpha-glucanotransferase DPE2 [Platanthera guangdongensis]|uniref:4-alpha-glucanotransferase n=1 Tax=Platanthera guangdongensis TaxID=2320717 RepID=A0ABR2LX34_9ASPA
MSSSSLPKYVTLSDGSFRATPWRGAGVAIPMFSVRTNEDLGVGEFLDLKLLVDLAVESGFHLIQLLPINDTSVHGMWWDSYPYSSLSVFALHPLYLRVQLLSENIPDNLKQEILMEKKHLDKKDVDYEATMAAKLAIAKKIFNMEKDQILNSSLFIKFVSDNEEWLKPYAAFCFLRDFFGTSDHSQWGRFAEFSKEKLEKLLSKDTLHYDVICFHYYIQFHLHLQLSEASTYARRKKVILKGDLPIGVDRNSVDTWVYPNLFRMNKSTGAPPDYFDKNGQNWGFPTYNWEMMSKDNYTWWRARLTQMAKYFTAYRIDHILGFFRIWELPDHAATGLVGKFRPSIALSQEELEREGIWDFDRLCRPYIQQNTLQDTFGATWTFIASCFLREYSKECYEFKEDCDTEKKIIGKLRFSPEKSVWADKELEVRRGLFDLLQDGDRRLRARRPPAALGSPTSRVAGGRRPVKKMCKLFSRSGGRRPRVRRPPTALGSPAWPPWTRQRPRRRAQGGRRPASPRLPTAAAGKNIHSSGFTAQSTAATASPATEHNIVLIRDCEDHGKFYPRFNLEDTSSFQKLDDHSKHVLKRLYYDYYFHRQENLWLENAMKTLPALLSSSDMLACGEDLGLIPSCVHPVMLELGLIGLRIQRMPSEPGLQFGIPSQYNYMTVCAPSCHDCSTIRAWWEEDEERRCRFYKDVIGSNDEPPSQCTPEVANFILHQHFLAPSMWAIFPLQDVLALKEEYTDRPANEETINDPTNPKHYWRFREYFSLFEDENHFSLNFSLLIIFGEFLSSGMHVTLESLLGDEDLKITIKDLVASSGRSYPISEYEMKKQVENIEDELFSRLQLNGD